MQTFVISATSQYNINYHKKNKINMSQKANFICCNDQTTISGITGKSHLYSGFYETKQQK